MMQNNFKIGDEFLIEVYEEICCELCNEPIHNHIDCPVCKKEYAPTSVYGSIECEDIMSCENCLTVFEKIDNKDRYVIEYKFKIKELRNEYKQH